jgi:hypothetical protein
MKVKIISFAFTLFFCLGNLRAQTNDINFLVQAIKTSYAGYADKTSDNDFDMFVKKAIQKYPTDTFQILSRIAKYFNDPHLSVIAYRGNKIDTSSYLQNIQMNKEYFADNRRKKDSYEGYWVNDYNNCVIVLKKNNHSTWKYSAYVIESFDSVLPSGMISARFEQIGKKKYLVDYNSPHSGARTYFKAIFRNDSLFTTGNSSKWRKLKTYDTPILPSLARHSEMASAQLLDNNTFLITIPANSEENTWIVDSIVKANSNVLSHTKTLILDIRNNTGGTIRTYAQLLPYVYTKPIIRIGGYRKYSDYMLLGAEDELKELKINSSHDTAAIAKTKQYISTIKQNIGKWILDAGDTLKLDSIKTHPEHIAIIANYACLSAAEMMIMDFKQSSKVTVFGETTFGGLDYLDNFWLDLPSKKYMLNIASLKRSIPKGQNKLDNIGIKPDVPIDDSVEDWIEFVRNYYHRK